MKKKLLLIMCIMLLLTGCSQKHDTAVISPINTGNSDTMTTSLNVYYGYSSNTYLCSELRQITDNQSTLIEKLAIEEIIKGPSNNELSALITKETTVSVEGISDTLFVTLSDDFMLTLPTENSNFKNNEQDNKAVLNRRKMAIYAIVNTVTELGNYQRVQISIKDKKKNTTYRPTLYEVGLSNVESENVFLEVLTHAPEYNLSPVAVLNNAFGYVQKQNFHSLYKSISQINSSVKISETDFLSMVKDTKLKITETVIDPNVTYTSTGIAIVNANFIFEQNGETHSFTNYPVRVILDNNIWKLEYNSVSDIFNRE